MLQIIQTNNNYTQQNRKCRLCRERAEMVHHIISECIKLAQKQYKTRHDWVGKVIHRKLTFDHTTIWYIHEPEFVQENVSKISNLSRG